MVEIAALLYLIAGDFFAAVAAFVLGFTLPMMVIIYAVKTFMLKSVISK